MAYEEICLKTETGRCLLCHDPACQKACPNKIPTDQVIRSVRFENMIGAKRKMGDGEACEGCDEPCKDACLRGKMDRSVDIPGVIRNVSSLKEIYPETVETGMTAEQSVDLSIDFCGVHCENPFFLSSSVIGSNYEMVAKAFDMGWGGVAFKTIGMFVPKEVSPRFGALEKENQPFVGLKNIEQISDHGLEENLAYLKQLKQDYPFKVIIASIMGQNEEEWTTLARLAENAGADIIECNFSCPQMEGEGLGSDVGTDPELVRIYTAAVRRGTGLPILAKMTPNITSMEEPARAAVEAGANGIAAINTIKSIMNVDLHDFTTSPNVDGRSTVGGYSGKAVKPIALRFIHDMKKDPVLADVPISGMGGIETWIDAAEFIAMGCETVQVTTAVMQYGYRIIEDMTEGLSHYMKAEGISHVSDLVGRALPHMVSADELNRSSIEYPRFNRSICVGCGRCYLSCFDGGHQAVRLDEESGKPILDAKKCVGCQLCKLVCPAGAISSGVRTAKAIQ